MKMTHHYYICAHMQEFGIKLQMLKKVKHIFVSYDKNLLSYFFNNSRNCYSIILTQTYKNFGLNCRCKNI